MEGSFPLAYPLVQCLLRSVCKEDESTLLWHSQGEGELYLDNEMAPNPNLSLSLSFSSVSWLLMTPKPIIISSGLPRDWLYIDGPFHMIS